MVSHCGVGVGRMHLIRSTCIALVSWFWHNTCTEAPKGGDTVMQWTLLGLHVVMLWWWKVLVFLVHWHTLSMLPWLRLTPAHTACHLVCATCPATHNQLSIGRSCPRLWHNTFCVGVIICQGVLIANRFCYNVNRCQFDSQRHPASHLCCDVFVMHSICGWCFLAWTRWFIAMHGILKFQNLNPILCGQHLTITYMHTYNITSDCYEYGIEQDSTLN